MAVYPPTDQAPDGHAALAPPAQTVLHGLPVEQAFEHIWSPLDAHVTHG
jgi:hypothetical protein